MGIVNRLEGKRVYLDANLFIYLLEADDYPLQRDAVAGVFRMLDTGKMTGVVSEFALGEILPHPLRHGRQDQVDAYREIFTIKTALNVFPVSLEVIDAAAVIRVHSSIKMPDALHLATALEHGCEIFLTNDKKIRPPEGLPIELINLESLS